MKILIVSPHPDDETLGAGGSILRYKAQGHKLFCLNITNISEKFGYSSKEVLTRKREIARVRNAYALDGFFDLGLEPSTLHEYQSQMLIKEISKIMVKINPEIVILPYRSDIHSDHRIVFDAVSSCTKNFRYPSIRKILMMEILSETNFILAGEKFSPNYYVNIDKYITKKIDIMKIYKKEIKDHPFPRSTDSIRALAILRGSEAGYKFAEAFKILKWLD